MITCSDFRFKTTSRSLAVAAGLGDDYDLLARPGSIRSLVAPRNASAHESFVDEVALLHGLHSFRRILMVSHLSCRAYDDIASPDNERAIHTGHLHAACAFIERAHADVVVETYLIGLTNGMLRAERISH